MFFRDLSLGKADVATRGTHLLASKPSLRVLSSLREALALGQVFSFYVQAQLMKKDQEVIKTG